MFKKLFTSAFVLTIIASQISITSMAQSLDGPPIAPPIPMPFAPEDGKSSTGMTTSQAASTPANTNPNPPTSAPTNIEGPTKTTVTPTTASDSLITPTWGMNVRACLEVFNWETYEAEKAAGRTNSNPYDKKGCLTQKNLVTNSANPDSPTDPDGKGVLTKDASGKITAVNYNVGPIRIRDKDNNPATPVMYKDFENTDNAEAKAAFGDIPVMGIFPNGTLPAQSINTYDIDGKLVANGSNIDRSKLDTPAALTSIYAESELAKIYNSGAARTGAPRLVFTGPDRLTPGKTDSYDGGTCYPEGGKMKVRTSVLTGTPAQVETDPESYGDPSNPLVSCQWRFPDGTRSPIVIDRNMEVRQFVFVINYPTQSQCTALWKIPANQFDYCQKFFRDRIGKVLSGKDDGNKIVYTYTYYGMWSDASNICQTLGTTKATDCSPAYRWNNNTNWADPDQKGPRSTFSTTATEAQLIGFYSDTRVSRTPLIAPAFGCTVDSKEGICGKKAVDLPTLKSTFTPAQVTAYDNYIKQLKGQFDGYVRAYKGYSVYVL